MDIPTIESDTNGKQEVKRNPNLQGQRRLQERNGAIKRHIDQEDLGDAAPGSKYHAFNVDLNFCAGQCFALAMFDHARQRLVETAHFIASVCQSPIQNLSLKTRQCLQGIRYKAFAKSSKAPP